MSRPFLKTSREILGRDLQNKKNFGLLQQFDELIIFGAGNKSGFFVEADFNKMAPTIIQAFQQQPDLKEFFKKCIDHTPKIITL